MTLAELNRMCAEFSALRKARTALEDQVSEINAKLSDLEARIIEILAAHKMDNYRGEFGQIIINERKTFLQPATIEAKLKLFEHLKEQGLFNEMVSVNSAKLSAWAKKEVELKEAEGILGYMPPGLDKTHEVPKLSLRK